MRENGIEESIDRPLTIALVVDTVGNQGNGTSNSALQWAAELERQGHHVRLVGIGAPEYPARVNRVPLVSWVAAQAAHAIRRTQRHVVPHRLPRRGCGAYLYAVQIRPSCR